MNVPTTTPETLTDCARRLESLVRRASALVAHQLGQLDDIGLQMAAEARQTATRDAAEAFIPTGWGEQTTDGQQRVDEQLDHLAKAWKELESEQRRLLTRDGSTQSQVIESTSPMAAEPAPAGGAEPAGPVDDDPAPKRRSRDLIDATAPQDAAAAALQFQKLKREIRQQNRRQR